MLDKQNNKIIATMTKNITMHCQFKSVIVQYILCGNHDSWFSWVNSIVKGDQHKSIE